jgi:hypothetical protein
MYSLEGDVIIFCIVFRPDAFYACMGKLSGNLRIKNVHGDVHRIAFGNYTIQSQPLSGIDQIYAVIAFAIFLYIEVKRQFLFRKGYNTTPSAIS